MAQVFNWQIGREMDYWYTGVRPGRQFGAVFDINKCIACQTCTVACKTTWTGGRGQEYMFWNNVESKPFGFYPIMWDVKLLEMLGPGAWREGVYEGRTIFESAPAKERVLGWKPTDYDYAHPNLGEDEASSPVDGGLMMEGKHAAWMFYLARICNHCTYPACLAACPRGAIYKRKEDGIVLVNQKNCRGYQECVKACPYKKTFYNAVEGVSQKCIACYPAVERGFQPQCFKACIGKIRMQGWAHPPERAEEDNPIDYLVHVRKLALPLLPQLGLEPNVYYIPPVHASDAFLAQMFGPGAKQAVQTYLEARNDKVLAGLLTLLGSTHRTVDYFKIEGDEAVALDAERSEFCRVPISEPVVTRNAYDEIAQVGRHNIT